MSWESTESYEQLLEMQPELKDTHHQQAFHEFVARMWTKPSTFIEFTQAYMEFTTPRKLTFPKLQARAPKENVSKPARKSRRSRRRSSRKRKQTRSSS